MGECGALASGMPVAVPPPARGGVGESSKLALGLGKAEARGVRVGGGEGEREGADEAEAAGECVGVGGLGLERAVCAGCLEAEGVSGTEVVGEAEAWGLEGLQWPPKKKLIPGLSGLAAYAQISARHLFCQMVILLAGQPPSLPLQECTQGAVQERSL